MSQMVKPRQRQTKHVLQLLKQGYPDAKIVLNWANPWELLVAVVLSAQCTDVMVNKVTAGLFAKYKTLDDYVTADLKEFESEIKSTGFYHHKAKNILTSSKLVKEKFRGKVPDTMEELLTLPGVARKTANIILGNAFGKVEGIAVDAHVHRITQRLRLVDLDTIGGKKELIFIKAGRKLVDYKKDADPVKIERELMWVLPHSDWFKFTYLIIDHGRAICRAQNPNCARCALSRLCPASRV